MNYLRFLHRALGHSEYSWLPLLLAAVNRRLPQESQLVPGDLVEDAGPVLVSHLEHAVLSAERLLLDLAFEMGTMSANECAIHLSQSLHASRAGTIEEMERNGFSKEFDCAIL